MGTRFLPATKSTPKEMLALVDKPLIQYVVEEAVASGITEIILVTGRNKNAIEDHFDRSVELELHLESKNDHERLKLVRHISDMCEVCYIRQKKPLGLGHAILRSRELIGDEPFAVLLGDDIIHSNGRPVIGQLMDVYDNVNAPVIAVEQIPEERISSYGVIEPKKMDDRLSKIISMVEKPPRDQAPSNLAIIGRYILTPEVFDYLEKTEPDHKGEVQLTTALNAMLGNSEMYSHEFEGTRYDAGDKFGLLKATVEFALRRDDMNGEFREYLKQLKL